MENAEIVGFVLSVQVDSMAETPASLLHLTLQQLSSRYKIWESGLDDLVKQRDSLSREIFKVRTELNELELEMERRSSKERRVGK
jgi:vacuolar-type H+-ATPase subunit D/Vma8